MQKAVFLDRDGVINVDTDYVHTIEEFQFIPGVFQAVRHYKQAGYLVFVITNQSGIGRGKYTEEQYQILTRWMEERFREENAEVTAVYHCPHRPEEGCACRKPKPGMLHQARDEHGADLSRSWLVGDKESDLGAAINAGLPHYGLVRTGHKLNESGTKAQFIVNSLLDTIAIIQ